jgi:hypothetical protein
LNHAVQRKAATRTEAQLIGSLLLAALWAMHLNN